MTANQPHPSGGSAGAQLTTLSPPPGRDRRLGRALVYVHAQDLSISDQVTRARLGATLISGRAMDLAARLRSLRDRLGPDVALRYAELCGIGRLELTGHVLPALKAADVIDYELRDGNLHRIEEFVGVSGPLISQGLRVFQQLAPTDVEHAVLHSVELASWAPLTASDHLQQLSARGFADQVATEAMQLTLAASVNQRVRSQALNEMVIFNPNVWGAQHASVAEFLTGLAPGERDALLGVVEMASDRPGLALPGYAAFDPAVLRSARKVGLVQAANVRSSRTGTGTAHTYVFSPMLERADDQLVATEALHERKLFVAHILYGHEQAMAGYGTIRDPLILVDRLLSRRRVGPASNIASDYHLLESHGIVSVNNAGWGDERAYLNLVKADVVEAGLGWLQSALNRQTPSSGSADPQLLAAPGRFITPDQDRAQLSAQGAAGEITGAAVLQLRDAIEGAQRAARFDF